MISFDLECPGGHRFEGIFSDYDSFASHLERNMITCPVCNSGGVKRLFTGCSIQARPSTPTSLQKKNPNIFDAMRMIESYIRENFENVGRDFPEVARAIYYGDEKQRNIYGESNIEEIQELIEEGIHVLPVPDIEKIEN